MQFVLAWGIPKLFMRVSGWFSKNHLINILMELYEVVKLLKILTELPIVRQSAEVTLNFGEF
jgi:hypothetical protein